KVRRIIGRALRFLLADAVASRKGFGCHRSATSARNQQPTQLLGRNAGPMARCSQPNAGKARELHSPEIAGGGERRALRFKAPPIMRSPPHCPNSRRSSATNAGRHPAESVPCIG